MINSGILYTHAYSSDFVTKAFNHEIIQRFDIDHPPQIKVSIEINMIETFKNVLDFITQDVSFSAVQFAEPGSFIVQNKNNLLIHGKIEDDHPFQKVNRLCAVNLSGTYEAVERTYQRLYDYDQNNKKTIVHWWFKTKDDINSVPFLLSKKNPVKSEFYPWIGDIDDFLKRFDESSSNILILLGDPGTGKTSFIRNLITSTNQHCFTTYDEEVMNNDQIYIKFLSNDDAKYLVLEDSDLLLTERLHTGNRVMSKMLNAADGLVSFKNKKIIFTANIRDKNAIDEALMRPGRCFDIIEFRSLTGDGAETAAGAAGIDFQRKTGQRYSLAEIFNKP